MQTPFFIFKLPQIITSMEFTGAYWCLTFEDIETILKKMGKWFSIISIFMLLVLFGCGGGGEGGQGVQNRATLTWNPPTTNVDGTELTDLAGYNIYYGTSSGNYTETANLANPNTTEYTIDNLSPNTYYFAVTAYDEMGNESDYSNEVSKTIQ